MLQVCDKPKVKNAVQYTSRNFIFFFAFLLKAIVSSFGIFH